MTPQEQKELAEFGAEFLGLKVSESNLYTIVEGLHIEKNSLYLHMFDSSMIAPILAHLAKREMEKREFGIFSSYTWKNDGKPFYVYYINHYDYKTFRGEGDSEYIALWLAIREAVK